MDTLVIHLSLFL